MLDMNDNGVFDAGDVSFSYGADAGVIRNRRCAGPARARASRRGPNLGPVLPELLTRVFRSGYHQVDRLVQPVVDRRRLCTTEYASRSLFTSTPCVAFLQRRSKVRRSKV